MEKNDIDVKNVFMGKVGFTKLQERENQVYIKIRQDELEKAISLFAENYFLLISLFGENTSEEGDFTLFYVFEKSGHGTIIILLVPIKTLVIRSIGSHFPTAIWYERELSDGFGLLIENAQDTRRLFLHEYYPLDFHPLLKKYKNKKMHPLPKNILGKSNPDYKFMEMKGEGIHQVPVGPIHAGIIEPGHFRFSAMGEKIYNLEIRMFFKHRGLEKLAEDKNPKEVVAIAESISGDETVSNSVAYCNAIEQVSGHNVPERATFLRGILLELERIYSHLGDLGGMSIDVAYPVGASSIFVLREEIFRRNQLLTGSRFMKGIVCVGGLAKDISKKELLNLKIFLIAFRLRLKEAIKNIYKSSSVEDRFETTGIIKHDRVRHLNITGPAARASGAAKDTRVDHPYGVYKKLTISTYTKNQGDVQARFKIKIDELFESIRIIQDALKLVSSGDVKKEIIVKDGFIISLIEAPRGQNMHYVHIKNGLVQRYKIRTASFCNWQAIEHAVLNDIVPDFPLINKSLNLSYAGTDL